MICKPIFLSALLGLLFTMSGFSSAYAVNVSLAGSNHAEAGSVQSYTFTFEYVISYTSPLSAEIHITGGVFPDGSTTMQNVRPGRTNFQVQWYQSGHIYILYRYNVIYQQYPSHGSLNKSVTVTGNGLQLQAPEDTDEDKLSAGYGAPTESEDQLWITFVQRTLVNAPVRNEQTEV